MKLHYYPGCSLEGTAREYDRSTRALMAALDVELVEIEGWTCCGASAAESVSPLLALALPARNLALAEKGDAGATDILVPCSACYLNLRTAEEKHRNDPAAAARLDLVLAEEGLHLAHPPRVRHLLDVLATDLGKEAIASRVRRQLAGVTIAPYYGCQCLRPFGGFDDPETPVSMEPLIRATGAGVLPWRMGARCCGASHMNTQQAVGLSLTASILEAAKGADAIVTVCPMCQMNLEGFQHAAGRLQKRDLTMDILYLPQLLGIALGIEEGKLGLEDNLALKRRWMDRLPTAPDAPLPPAAGNG